MSIDHSPPGLLISTFGTVSKAIQLKSKIVSLKILQGEVPGSKNDLSSSSMISSKNDVRTSQGKTGINPEGAMAWSMSAPGKHRGAATERTEKLAKKTREHV
ncbi:hypothetical protein C8J56DRAFT_882109 [Mycena floridula]|nr:hypothetical protein C8J56DRAFT_882109 [Mycena floridula]